MQLGWQPVAVVQYTFTHKQYIEQYNRHKQYIERNYVIGKSAGRAPSLELYPGICLTTKVKAWKSLIQGSRKMPAATLKTEHTE